MPQYLPDLELPDPEVDDRDRKASSCPSKPPGRSAPDQNDTDPPHVREALRAIVRLLARQAARDHLAQGECP